MASLRQLIRTWWQQDRIRVGRSCGQLLSLNIGARLLMDDDIFMVVKRWTDSPSTSVTNTREAAKSRVAEEWFDQPSTESVPRCIKYLLIAWSAELDVSMLSEEKTFNQVARLIVPLASQEAIQFECSQQIRELLPEEIVIL